MYIFLEKVQIVCLKRNTKYKQMFAVRVLGLWALDGPDYA